MIGSGNDILKSFGVFPSDRAWRQSWPTSTTRSGSRLVSSYVAGRACLSPPPSNLTNAIPDRRHVANTEEIKNFVIVSEGSVAKGIRRIVAVTDDHARAALRVADDFSTRLDGLSGLAARERGIRLKRYMAVSTK